MRVGLGLRGVGFLGATTIRDLGNSGFVNWTLPNRSHNNNEQGRFFGVPVGLGAWAFCGRGFRGHLRCRFSLIQATGVLLCSGPLAIKLGV